MEICVPTGARHICEEEEMASWEGVRQGKRWECKYHKPKSANNYSPAVLLAMPLFRLDPHPQLIAWAPLDSSWLKGRQALVEQQCGGSFQCPESAVWRLDMLSYPLSFLPPRHVWLYTERKYTSSYVLGHTLPPLWNVSQNVMQRLLSLILALLGFRNYTPLQEWVRADTKQQ